MSKTWTPERKTMVREMLIEGLTGKEIADRLGNGITRNAVIGFVHRNADLKAIGFKRSSSESNEAIEARTKRVSVAAQRKRGGVRCGTVSRNRLNVVPTPPIVEAFEAIPDVPGRFGAPHVAGIPMWDDVRGCSMLTQHRCAWPISDGGPFLFCGEAKKFDRPYCAFHATVAKGEGTKSERTAERDALRITA